MRFGPWLGAFILLLALASAATPPPPPRVLALAVEAMQRGGCAAHLEDLRRLAQDPSPTGARAVYLLGHCLLQVRRLPESREAFLEAADRHPALAGYARLQAGRVSLEMGDAPGAAAVLAARSDRTSGILARRNALVEAEALLLSGRPGEAVAVVRPVLQAEEEDDEIRARTWWVLGQAAEAAGDTTLAVRAYGMVWWGIPGNPHEAAAGLRLQRLTGEPQPSPHGEARVERAARLIKIVERQQAERELVLALRGDLPAAVAFRAHYQLGFLRMGRRGAVDAFTQAARYPTRPDRTLYWLGQAHFAIGRSSAGQAVWERLVRAHPASAWSGRALLALGRNAEVRQQWSEADRWYTRSAEVAPQSSGADEARWRRGWIRFRQGRYGEAERLFRQYADAFSSTPRAAAHLYWAARSREQRGARAGDLLRATAERYPLTFYGQRARARLGALPLQLADLPPEERLPSDAFGNTADELAGLGFFQEAADEVAELLAADPSPRVLLRVARLSARAGDLAASVAAAERLVTPALYGTAPVEREVWELAYPRAFWPQVVEMSARVGVDPYLSLAVMREESRFDPRAVSSAQAIGLMQLLHSTAQGVLGGGVTPLELMDPSVNIRAGTAYLGGLLRRYGGSVPLAVAAYNAGPGGVRRVSELARTDVERFVESLPYAETRAYAQRVLQSYGIYRWLYGSER